jgi:tetratricopeptide (TPR) repeat protein
MMTPRPARAPRALLCASMVGALALGACSTAEMAGFGPQAELAGTAAGEPPTAATAAEPIAAATMVASAPEAIAAASDSSVMPPSTSDPTSGPVPNVFAPPPTEPATTATTMAVTEVAVAPGAPPTKPLDEIKDDLTLGKEHYRARNYGLAELHFRRAVEARRGDPEAWLGLAAAYDQLKRFGLADRAYRQVVKLTGPTAEVLNNRGYSYLLRGNLRRASQDLSAAAAIDPGNERIQNNLRLLDRRARGRV